MATGLERAAGLLLGVALDAAVGDPRRFHPVAGFGTCVRRLERLLWADSRGRGAVFAGLGVGSAVAMGLGVDRLVRRHRWSRVAACVVATWAVLGARSLAAEGDTLAAMLEEGDVPAARDRVTHLVSRDPSGLDEGDIARAAVESVAENASDAIVAPLLWGAVAGVPGLVGYRAVNTLDAMVGYRSDRYLRFGWASARLDDLANLLPARVTAALVAAISGRPGGTWRATLRDAGQHPSPNSGWPEAAYAAALDLRLGGANRYGDTVEHRPFLGDGRAPEVSDIRRATALTRRVSVASALVAAGFAVSRFGRLRRRLPGRIVALR